MVMIVIFLLVKVMGSEVFVISRDFEFLRILRDSLGLVLVIIFFL